MSRHHTKRHHMYLSAILLILQWFSISMYIYCIKTYWTSGGGPRIPRDTMVVMVALNTSTAVSFTLSVIYFYQSSNNFKSHLDNRAISSFNLVPNIRLGIQGKNAPASLSPEDWLLVNVLLAVGLIAIAGVFIGAFAFNAFMNFYGIHNFTANIRGPQSDLYLLAVAVVYWGFCATVCTCCIFHVSTRSIINNVELIERLMLSPTLSRHDFFEYHEALLQYSEKMMRSLRYWFAAHNIFFVFLILATVFEWINVIKSTEEKHIENYNIWFAQLTGSCLISYKFAFPFISASRVTARFNLFYYNVARLTKVCDIPDLAVLREHSGFKLFGFRITTSVAMVAIFSSFIGALKFIADFSTNES